MGLRGEITLRPAADFWAGALESEHLVLVRGAGEQAATVDGQRPHGAAAAVLKLRGIDDRTAAEKLVGMELVLPTTALDVALPEKWRPFQLRGLRVETVQGELVGEVCDVEALPAQDLLVVRGPRGEHRVPLVPAIVPDIDLEAGLVRIDPPAGLLEL